MPSFCPRIVLVLRQYLNALPGALYGESAFVDWYPTATLPAATLADASIFLRLNFRGCSEIFFIKDMNPSYRQMKEKVNLFRQQLGRTKARLYKSPELYALHPKIGRNAHRRLFCILVFQFVMILVLRSRDPIIKLTSNCPYGVAGENSV